MLLRHAQGVGSFKASSKIHEARIKDYRLKGDLNVRTEDHSFQNVGLRSPSGCELAPDCFFDYLVACSRRLSERVTWLVDRHILVDGHSRSARTLWLHCHS